MFQKQQMTCSQLSKIETKNKHQADRMFVIRNLVLFQIKSFIILAAVAYAEACYQLTRPIYALLPPNNSASFEKMSPW